MIERMRRSSFMTNCPSVFGLLGCLMVFIFILCACSTDESLYHYDKYTLDKNKPDAPKNIVLMHVTSYQQTTSYTCGPAVIMTLLHYYGKLSLSDMNQRTELRIANEMGTNILGTTQQSIVSWLENHGFSVTAGQGVTLDMLVNNIKLNIPTIIVLNEWSGHSMLVVGYAAHGAEPDGDHDVIFFADPSTSSYLVEQKNLIFGINTLTAEQLKLNWFYSKYFFNPSHTAVGMYVVAIPKSTL